MNVFQQVFANLSPTSNNNFENSKKNLNKISSPIINEKNNDIKIENIKKIKKNPKTPKIKKIEIEKEFNKDLTIKKLNDSEQEIQKLTDLIENEKNIYNNNKILKNDILIQNKDFKSQIEILTSRISIQNQKLQSIDTEFESKCREREEFWNLKLNEMKLKIISLKEKMN